MFLTGLWCKSEAADVAYQEINCNANCFKAEHTSGRIVRGCADVMGTYFSGNNVSLAECTCGTAECIIQGDANKYCLCGTDLCN